MHMSSLLRQIYAESFRAAICQFWVAPTGVASQSRFALPKQQLEHLVLICWTEDHILVKCHLQRQERGSQNV